MSEAIYGFEVQTIKGENVTLEDYRGRVLLIVNTASKCAFTPQYKGLEELHEEYSDNGLTILGFPCNQFGLQEPGNDGQIEEFCQLNYGVSFPMFGKVKVNGFSAHPLFKHLKKEAKGFMGSGNIKWNFTKFLVNREGEVVKRFAPTDTPSSIVKEIEALL